MKDTKLKKSVKNGVVGLVILMSFSFFYGGIYVEMITKGAGITFSNIVAALLGAFISGIFLGFIPVFIVTLIFQYLKKDSPVKKETEVNK